MTEPSAWYNIDRSGKFHRHIAAASQTRTLLWRNCFGTYAQDREKSMSCKLRCSRLHASMTNLVLRVEYVGHCERFTVNNEDVLRKIVSL